MSIRDTYVADVSTTNQWDVGTVLSAKENIYALKRRNHILIYTD
jgi:hypothetical protein